MDENTHSTIIELMFKTAIKWRWLVENPAREIDAPPTRIKRQQRALSVGQVSLFFERLVDPEREAAQKIEKLILFPREQATGE